MLQAARDFRDKCRLDLLQWNRNQRKFEVIEVVSGSHRVKLILDNGLLLVKLVAKVHLIELKIVEMILSGGGKCVILISPRDLLLILGKYWIIQILVIILN